jgi:hypothetical protein
VLRQQRLHPLSLYNIFTHLTANLTTELQRCY